MKIKHNIRTVLFGIAVALLTAPGVFASSDITKVMTDPCANVMTARPIAYYPTPPSERGLQCPIQHYSGVPLE